MFTDVVVQSTNHKIIWRYQRDEQIAELQKQLTQAISDFKGQPFVLLIDLQKIRYILPEDRQLIVQICDSLRTTPPFETVYLVDFRNYNRMQLLITLNHFPNSELVFKYEVDAMDYLDQIILKHFSKTKRISII